MLLGPDPTLGVAHALALMYAPCGPFGGIAGMPKNGTSAPLALFQTASCS
jgi:hypothetical protein